MEPAVDGRVLRRRTFSNTFPRGREVWLGGLDGELSRLVVGRPERFLWMDFFSTEEVPSRMGSRQHHANPAPGANDESNCIPCRLLRWEIHLRFSGAQRMYPEGGDAGAWGWFEMTY